MVDVWPKTNSVTISTGIRLAAFLSSSLRSAPCRDYIGIRLASGAHILCSRRSYYLQGRAAVVDIRIEGTMIAKIEFIVEVIHGDVQVLAQLRLSSRRAYPDVFDVFDMLMVQVS